MSTVIDLFERHGYVLELLACVAATTWSGRSALRRG